jgi:hypothetical protein
MPMMQRLYLRETGGKPGDGETGGQTGRFSILRALPIAYQGLSVGGGVMILGAGVYTPRGAGAVFGVVFFGFFTSRFPLSLFPMPHSLP